MDNWLKGIARLMNASIDESQFLETYKLIKKGLDNRKHDESVHKKVIDMIINWFLRDGIDVDDEENTLDVDEENTFLVLFDSKIDTINRLRDNGVSFEHCKSLFIALKKGMDLWFNKLLDKK